MGSTVNCPSIRNGAVILDCVLSEIRIWSPVVKDSMRPVRLTLEPTAAYLVRE